jgi:hypothetical protein
MYFVYEGLGHLFLEKSDYKRYWVVATREECFDGLDSRNEDVTWSGRKEMRPEDLVFVYRMAPRKAMTDILQVKDEPVFDPWGAWDGFWVNLEKVCVIKNIPFAHMRKDDILGKWGTVNRNFVGTVAEPMPPAIYNRLLEKIPLEKIPSVTREMYGLESAPVGEPPTGKLPGLSHPTLATRHLSGQFETEAKFEDEVIVPLLKRWNLKYKRQHPCTFRIGRQDHRGKVDFHVSNREGPLTLFEDKLRIINDRDLEPAIAQAKSYALLLGLPSFVVASPEGMWLYSLDRNQEKLIKLPADTVDWEEEIKSLLLKLRQ